ncbi:MAG: Ig-like domain-containing protein, partial [Gemmatimonadetes bacterium]|nr:Ig-like domain-containing protein [Gemmatimonadota bacterium]
MAPLSRLLVVLTGGLVGAACDWFTGSTPVATVAVTPAAVTLGAVGDSVRLVAVTKSSDGTVLLDRQIEWRSGDPTVASVTATGLVTAVGNGTATVKASVEGVEGSAEVIVADRVLVVLGVLAEAQRVVEAATGHLADHPVVRMLAVLGPALSFGGGTLRDVLGSTFVYSSEFATYERDTTRRDAPSDGVRLILYQVEGSKVVLPLREIGHIDLLVAPGDTALTVKGHADRAAPLEYAAHGFDMELAPDQGVAMRDSSRMDVAGVVPSAIGNVDFALRERVERVRGPLLETLSSREYRVAVAGFGAVAAQLRTKCSSNASCLDSLSARIVFQSAGRNGDSARVEIQDVVTLGCNQPASQGIVRTDGAFLAVRTPFSGPPPRRPVGVLVSGNTVDTIISDTLTNFWKMVALPCGGPGQMAVAAAPMLSPARFAFRVVAAAVG